jgi:hypothetical protein
MTNQGPKLQDIRDAKSFEALKPAIRFLCDEMQKMTYGEFLAYRGTLQSQCIKIGHTLVELNAYAENYQIFGIID